MTGVTPDFAAGSLGVRAGFPEIAGRDNFGDDFARPQSGRLDVGDRVLGDATLFVAGVILPTDS